MSDRLKELRERSQKRKQLLAQAFGVSSPDGLKTVLKSKEDLEHEKKPKRIKNVASGEGIRKRPSQTEETSDKDSKHKDSSKDEDAEQFETDEVYTDSSTFLKGTQSANPHNDYCQHFVDTGERPQNFIRDVGLAMRFEEYPKLRELIRLKDELIETTNIPPMYLKCDLEAFELSELDSRFDVILLEPPLKEYQRAQGMVFDKYWDWDEGNNFECSLFHSGDDDYRLPGGRDGEFGGNKTRFDVILVEPPLKEYQRAQGMVFDKYWDWDEIERLDIPSVAAQRSFIWIWCGNDEGLERGRQCLKMWGYRRCEDICWIKTNIQNPGHNKNLEPNSILQRTKEHCLMGIKGTVKRSTDGDFIHANVDIDLIIEEQQEYGCKDKPVEIFHMIEHFCLGRRRLHLFARDSTIRPGWLSLGSELTSSNYEKSYYQSMFPDETSLTTGCSEEIERLRPKSPNRPGAQVGSTRGGRGGPGGGMRGDRGGRGMRGDRGGMSRGGPGRGMRGRGAPRVFRGAVPR